MKKLIAAYRSFSIKQKLFICIILISLAPQCLLVFGFFSGSKASLTETTQENIYQLVRVNNELINEQLETAREATMNILVDLELYEIFNRVNAEGINDRTTLEKDIHNVLLKYFDSMICVEQVDIITRTYSYPMRARNAQYVGFFESGPYQRVADRNGGIVWLTILDMDQYQIFDQALSCARQLNLTYVDRSGIGTPLPKEYERPVIRVQFSNDYFAARLEKNIASLEDAEYYLMDELGTPMIYGGDFPDFTMEAQWWEEIRAQQSGMIKVAARGGKQTVICFETLQQSGWTSIAVFSVDALASRLTAGLSRTFAGVIVIQVITSVLATLVAVRMISKRVKRLNQGVDSLKAGNFSTVIEDNKKDEFTYLVGNFNDMSQTLRQLIDENYKVRLSEQEARLQSLMMQFNPHYLYNTLNVINWVVLRGNTRRASALIVALGRMLRYTSDNRRECTPLADDIEWLNQYLTLMEARFEGLFTISWDVEPSCLQCELPKLFMQPLLENSILHGFSDRKMGGEIHIKIIRAGNDVISEVRDNGIGMSRKRIEEVLQDGAGSIGLNNINKRVQLMYGEAYGLTIESDEGFGCLVRVRMFIDPKTNQNARI